MNIQYPILAIDYGTKRIGLAVSDSKGLIGSPLTVLNVTKNMGIDKIIEEIKTIIQEYRIKTILMRAILLFKLKICYYLLVRILNLRRVKLI